MVLYSCLSLVEMAGSSQSLSQKPGLRVVGWVQPTDEKPWPWVGFTHPAL